MVELLRGALLRSSSPNPSVEALLHAFLPHPVIDHTHARAVLALTDQPDGEALCREVFGDRLAIVPYIMPGFGLARAAAEAQQREPAAEGLILLKHGIFTFGATAREAYERMIAMVTLAERRLERGRRPLVAAALPEGPAPRLADLAPLLRGRLAHDQGDGAHRRWLLDFRTSPAIRAYVDGAELGRYGRMGVVTPDHAIRTKNLPLLLTAPRADALAAWAEATGAAIARYEADYQAYVDRHAAPGTVALDPTPRVALVPGFGLFGIGASVGEAKVAADIAESTVDTITDAEAIGRFTPVAEDHVFDLEYWPLQQAKLGRAAE
jgi:rhamnose utilization protein RhaD (predicted bifunctional aldolase and dehydrogenase)